MPTEDPEERLEEARAADAERMERVRDQLTHMEGEHKIGAEPDGKSRPITQGDVEDRLAKYRQRGPDRYEARDESGKLVGSGTRPDALRGVAETRSRGEYPGEDDEGRRVTKRDGPRGRVIVRRVTGPKKEIVAVYQNGKRTK